MEARRILAVEHREKSAAVIKYLQRIYREKTTHLIHIGGRSADLNITSLLRMSKAKGRAGHVMEGNKYSGAAFELTNSGGFDDLVIGIDNLQRRSEEFKYIRSSSIVFTTANIITILL